MSGFTKVEHGVVKIKHHSTASIIEVIIQKREQVSQGVFEDLSEHHWFDYPEFDDLYEAIKIVKEIENK